MREEKNENIIETHSLKDYINLIRGNFLPIISIVGVSFILAIIYAVNARDIYKSTATLKVVKPQGNILYSPVIPEFQDFGNDRFLANEIEVLKTFNTRERVAKTLIEEFNEVGVKDSFYILLDLSSAFQETKSKLLSVNEITERLLTAVSIDQKRG
ncbi:MAG TPA: Wzz/FepE/Etk N-terminal domain-containing protein, partial [Ignavibacteriaceae bacterium]|nr:Wzz/FepE/Etk N-terminal domain-containing protein [Ignavibacteriaceae bacterium]